MCGVFGVVSTSPVSREMLDKAARIQRHRGPDAQGTKILILGSWHIGLAHQRLAIIDLSAAGTQPMLSPSGRSLIAYNGEVYNYLELRAELEARGTVFRTRTDTEVIAAACEEFGVAAALSRMNGMWAFAWVDLQNSALVIARDRFGVKPLYLYERDGTLAFASEIKTLVRALGLRCKVNLPVVATFLRALQLDTDEHTFFDGIVKLPPGHFARFDMVRSRPELQITRYWDLQYQSVREPTAADAIAHVRELLDDAVRLRLRSDVPVGLLLSGGLDSSAIAAIASARLAQDSDFTFISAVSDDPHSDESAFIHAVAAHLGRTVREVRLEIPQHDVMPLIARVTEQCDEPLGGFSCVAQNLLMQRAQEVGVTVLMSGQGADEAFCGYRKYAMFQLQALARTGRWGAALALLGGFLCRRTLLNQFNLADARRYMPGWLIPPVADVSGPALGGVPGFWPSLGNRADVRERQRVDIESLSVPALTHWEDRNSMAWSREVRNPFLDYRIVSFGVSLPMHLKVAAGWSKFVLRRAIEDKLPAGIAWRRDKRGFSTPESRMLRGEMRAQVMDLLSPASHMFQGGLVDLRAARSRFESFLHAPQGSRAAGSRDIFQLISLECWLRAYASNLSD